MAEAGQTRMTKDERYELFARLISAAFWAALAIGALVVGKGDLVATAILLCSALCVAAALFAKGLLAVIPLLPGRIVTFLGASRPSL